MSGFGHRVYKNYDPRAKVIKKLADEVFSIVGGDPLIQVLLNFDKSTFKHKLLQERLASFSLFPSSIWSAGCYCFGESCTLR